MVNQSLKFGYCRSLFFSLYPQPSSKLIHFPRPWHFHLILPLHYLCYCPTPCPTFSSWIILLVPWIFSFSAVLCPTSLPLTHARVICQRQKSDFDTPFSKMSQVPHWVENKFQSWDPRFSDFSWNTWSFPLHSHIIHHKLLVLLCSCSIELVGSLLESSSLQVLPGKFLLIILIVTSLRPFLNFLHTWPSFVDLLYW